LIFHFQRKQAKNLLLAAVLGYLTGQFGKYFVKLQLAPQVLKERQDPLVQPVGLALLGHKVM
jgi:H+/Cl- antiporter ClcA